MKSNASGRPKEGSDSAGKTGLFSNLFGRKSEINEPELRLISLSDVYKEIPETVNRGREQDIQCIFDILQKRERHNVVITGPFGVGKNAIVEAVAERIAKGTCPEDFKDKKIVQLVAEELCPNLYDPDEITGKLLALARYLTQNPDDILYVRNFNLIVEYGLLEHFKLIFQKFRCITTVDSQKYDEDLFEKDEFMLTYFEVLGIDDPKYEEVYDMLEYKIDELSKHHKVSITKADVELIMDIEYREKGILLPWDVIDSIDYVMGVCKNHGLDHVNIKAIFEINKYYIKDFFEIPQERIRMIVYHEVGHCIVGKACGIKFRGIQIIPSDGAYGTNYFEPEDKGTITRAEYINHICLHLSGFLSTERKGFDKIDGVADDLKSASITARNMVVNYGMEDEDLISYVESNGVQIAYMSDSMKEKLDESVRKILQEAIKKTRKILDDNAENIEILVQALLKKGFLTTSEVYALLDGDENGKKLSVDDIPDLRDLLFDEQKNI